MIPTIAIRSNHRGPSNTSPKSSPAGIIKHLQLWKCINVCFNIMYTCVKEKFIFFFIKEEIQPLVGNSCYDSKIKEPNGEHSADLFQILTHLKVF